MEYVCLLVFRCKKLDIDESEHIKSILEPDELIILQKISDCDENAKIQADWVSAHPDISEEKFERQLRQFEEWKGAMGLKNKS